VQQYLLTVLVVLLVPEVFPKGSFVKDLSQTNQLLGELQHYKVWFEPKKTKIRR